jgi:hypothetical protein
LFGSPENEESSLLELETVSGELTPLEKSILEFEST